MPSDSDGLRTLDVDSVPGIGAAPRERPLLLPSVYLASSHLDPVPGANHI